MYNKIVTKKLLPIFATFCLFLSSCGSNQSNTNSQNQIVSEKGIALVTETASENDIAPAVIESRSFSDFLDFPFQAETSSVDEKVGEGEDQHGNEVESINSNDQVEIDSLEVESELESVFKEVSENEDVEEGLEETVENLPLLTDGYPSHLDDRTKSKLVRLVPNSITLRDCVMRGEIRNYSEDQYARDVTITVGALDSEKNAEYHWPLTIKPGESAPFEIPVDWFPHLYSNSISENTWHTYSYFWDLLGNTYLDISNNFSSVSDIKRAFKLNADETEFEIFYQNPSHKFLIYDERALELEDSKHWSRYGRDYTVISEPQFDFIFSSELIKSQQLDPMLTTFVRYDYTDLFYVPSHMYPNIYQQGLDDKISNVRVYQTIRGYIQGDSSYSTKIFDVVELIPHSVIEVTDEDGFVLGFEVNPISNFENYDLVMQNNNYIKFLYPYTYVDPLSDRNTTGEAFTHKLKPQEGELYVSEESWDEIWVGGVSHSKLSSDFNLLVSEENFDSSSCFSSRPLCNFDFILLGNSAIVNEGTSDSLGRWSICPVSHPNPILDVEPALSVGIQSSDHNSIILRNDEVRLNDQTIRGLIFNPFTNLTARNVLVTAIDKDTEAQLGIWQWPLSIQPRENAPFEIILPDSSFTIDDVIFDISSTLSADIDPSRSFLLEAYSYGTVYPQDHEKLNKGNIFSPSSESFRVSSGEVFAFPRLLNIPYLRYTKEEFQNIYNNLFSNDYMEELRLFSFRDYYARLEPSDLYPELAKVVNNQFIKDLRAYTAIFDYDGNITDVKELPLFTSIEEQFGTNQTYVAVNSIPSPNRWSPNAVRILRIIPYEDEEDMKKGYYSQVWIGGANATQE